LDYPNSISVSVMDSTGIEDLESELVRICKQ